MGILDTLLKNPDMLGDVAKFATENPEIAKAAMEFFSSSDPGPLQCRGVQDPRNRHRINGRAGLQPCGGVREHCR